MATSDIKKGPLYVDSTNSRVGIGTSSPTQATLHVDGGSVPARFESTSASTSYVQFGASGTTNYGQVAMTGNDMTLRTGYTDRMTIDSSGRVTMPYALAVSSYLNVLHTHPGSGANKVNNWAASTGTGHIFPSTRAHSSFDYTNSRFIAPVAGLYLMSFKPDYGTNISTSHYVAFGINGSNRSFDVIEDMPINVNGGANFAAYLYLNQNDYVEVYTHGGTSYNLNSGGNQWNTWWFVIQLS